MHWETPNIFKLEYIGSEKVEGQGVNTDIFNVSYEDIINNFENETKKIINACDLEWNNKCLEFYNNKRPIKTASNTKARKKIYKSSLNSWKNYEKQLTNYFKNLNT